MILAIDCETTGLRSGYNDLLTVALVNSEFGVELVYRMRPINPDTIEQEALKINGLDRKEILSWEWPSGARKQLLIDLKKLIIKHRVDRFTPLGHNYIFDQGFLKVWLGSKYNDLFDRKYLDTMIIGNFIKDIENEHYSLSLRSLCEVYRIENLCAHNAISDAYTTEELYDKMKGVFLNGTVSR